MMYTIAPRTWYAFDYVTAGFEESHHSPIYVFSVTPKKTGKDIVEIEFFHANYPEGVQRKIYELRVIKRAAKYLIADRNLPGEKELPTVIVSDISFEWLRTHFPKWLKGKSGRGKDELDGMKVQQYLTRVFNV